MKKILLTLSFAGAVAFAASAQNAPVAHKDCSASCAKNGTAACCSKGAAGKTGTAMATKTATQKKEALASANSKAVTKQAEN